ncbi:MAG: 16S rRNA (guanine(966)-N(2))-methyltransferase RsmD [Candidatus Sericytochromatia bacterium]|nr:16S rRNA (guanine(966)-N(2))-methyltransferase RsmD [Candidatus Sericytochromatia bacterium]
MRIIAGRARGRLLQTLPGQATRPTQGKVRAALFSILTPRLPDSRWLDLFAGSGAVGLEAASRGAARVVLVERLPEALRVIRANVGATRLVVEVLPQDASAALQGLKGQLFDVVFADPPYAESAELWLGRIDAAELLAPGGCVVLEHHRDSDVPESVGALTRTATRVYSGTALSFYACGEEDRSREATG